jgi:O-acetyl-ADP-ribose deacetylase (regulator of RNase III)
MQGIVNTVITLDVTELQAPFILLHIGNNKGVMNAGVAKAIIEKWPSVKTDYLEARFDSSHGLPLGSILVTEVIPNGFVITMIAQNGYGRDSKLYLVYDALKECLNKVVPFYYQYQNSHNVFAPFQIGCGLAGGDWDTVREVFDKVKEFKPIYCKKPD